MNERDADADGIHFFDAAIVCAILDLILKYVKYCLKLFFSGIGA